MWIYVVHDMQIRYTYPCICQIYVCIYIYICMYIYIYMYTSDIVSFLFVFLPDIARQVGEQCDWPAAQSGMIRKCMTTLALRH